MWGGIYAVLFSISTILSHENPIKNGFIEREVLSYAKYTFSAVEFQNKIVGQEIQFSLYEKKKFGPLQRGRSISLTDQGGIWLGYGFIRKVGLSDTVNFNFDFFPIILQNLEVHKFLFGDDYPFYIDKNITKCEDSIYKLLAQINNENINKAIKYVENAYNKSNDVFLYNSNFKLKNLLGVKKNDDISYPVKYESYTFKNLKWNKEKKIIKKTQNYRNGLLIKKNSNNDRKNTNNTNNTNLTRSFGNNTLGYF